MSHQGGRQATGKGIEQVFDRVRSLIFTRQYGRLIRMQLKRLLVRHLLLGAVKTANRGAIVVPSDPLVGYSKPAFRQVRILFDSTDRTLQDALVYPVHLVYCSLFSHFLFPSVLLNVCNCSGVF
jgi:hypothetical protein